MYTLTLTDLRDYLRSLSEDEVVGTPKHAWECLGARTLNKKYPQHEWGTNNLAFYTWSDGHWHTILDGRVTDVLSDFDRINAGYTEVTKRQVREIIDYLEGREAPIKNPSLDVRC